MTLLKFGAVWKQEPYASETWRLATAMFLHSGFQHLLFNMFALFVFAPPMERILGSFKYAVLYLLSGLLAMRRPCTCPNGDTGRGSLRRDLWRVWSLSVYRYFPTMGARSGIAEDNYDYSWYWDCAVVCHHRHQLERSFGRLGGRIRIVRHIAAHSVVTGWQRIARTVLLSRTEREIRGT